MAGVQRTRIGYGNEGRTKQLAASLTDFIRLFSLYYPTSPNNTTHQISCCALLTGRGGWRWRWEGGLQRGNVRLSPPFFRVAHCLRSAPDSLLRSLSKSLSSSSPPRSHVYIRTLESVCLIKSVSRAWLTPSTFSLPGNCVRLCVELEHAPPSEVDLNKAMFTVSETKVFSTWSLTFHLIHGHQ